MAVHGLCGCVFDVVHKKCRKSIRVSLLNKFIGEPSCMCVLILLKYTDKYTKFKDLLRDYNYNLFVVWTATVLLYFFWSPTHMHVHPETKQVNKNLFRIQSLESLANNILQWMWCYTSQKRIN